MTVTKIDSTLAICATPQATDLDAAGFAGLTWVPINFIVTLPSFGVDENMVAQDYIAGGLSQHSKGFRRGQSSSLVVGYAPADAGQDALRTASALKTNHAFRLTSASGVIRYTRALVGRASFEGGEGEAFDNQTFPFVINQEPVTVDP